MKTQEAIWMAVTKAAASEKDPRKNGDTKSLRLEEEDEYEEVEKQREREREREKESHVERISNMVLEESVISCSRTR